MKHEYKNKELEVEHKFQIFVCVTTKEQAEYTIKNLNKFQDIITIYIEPNASSFSYLVNKCIKNCSSDYMIFCSHRTNPTEDDLNRLLCMLEKGYGYVGLWRFAFFGINMKIINKVGYFDEKFVKGGYEDDDFRLRLNYYNIGFYEDHSISYNVGPSLFSTELIAMKNREYFFTKYTVDEDNKVIIINKLEKTNENYSLPGLLSYNDSIHVRDVFSYYGRMGPGIHYFKIIKADTCEYLDHTL